MRLLLVTLALFSVSPARAADIYDQSAVPLEVDAPKAGLAKVVKAKGELTRLDARVELARADSTYRELSSQDADRAPSNGDTHAAPGERSAGRRAVQG